MWLRNSIIHKVKLKTKPLRTKESQSWRDQGKEPSPIASSAIRDCPISSTQMPPFKAVLAIEG